MPRSALLRMAIRRAGLATALLALAATGPLSAQSLNRKIDDLVRTYHEQARFNGAVLVAHRGKVIYRKAYGWANAEWGKANTPTTRFRIGSITKQFTAMLILELMEEGKLRLDGTIRDYLPEYPAPAGDQVTIHQLLTHTSGIPSYTDQPGFFAERSRTPMAPMRLLATFDSLPFDFPPGTLWRYNNSGFVILGAIIERLTGMGYDEALRSRILEPLGLKETGYDWSADIIPERASAYNMTLGGLRHADYIDMSLPHAAGAMYSSADDLWRWDQALAARKLLKPETYQLFESPHVASPVFSHYAYGWFVDKVARGAGDSATAIFHAGGINGFVTMNFRVPEDGIAIIWLDNTASGAPLHTEILKLIYGQPVTLPKPSIARALLPIIKEKGAEAGIQEYRRARSTKGDQFDFAEPELNNLGYALLRGGRLADAIRIFALNCEMFPQGFNTWDSLGEAYLASGDTTLARMNYRKSLELNPQNGNAAQILARLGER
jgi:CubicO group peptidase (beta-lactamase class C family)